MKFDADFLKDRYDYELRRREELTDALTLPVGVLTVLGGAMATMARSFSYETGLVTWAFGALLSLSAFAFGRCLLRLWRAYHAQTYMYLPLLAAIKEAREGFLKFSKVAEHGEAEVLDEFDHQFHEHIIAAADHNTQKNDYRSDQLHSARVALFDVLILTTVLGVLYVVDQVRY